MKEIKAHDTEVWLTNYTIKYKVNDGDWKYTTGVSGTKNLIGSSGVYADRAALLVDYPTSGTVLATTTSATAPVTTYDAIGANVVNDGYSYDTRFVKISKELKSGEGTITAKVGDTTYAVSTHAVGSTDIAIPANSNVEVTALKGNALSYRANDAAKTPFTTTTTADAVATIKTGVADITFAALQEIQLQALNDVNSVGHMTLTWKVNGETKTGTIKAAPGDKITAELAFDDTGVTFSGTATRKIEVIQTGENITATAPTGVDLSVGSWETEDTTGTLTINSGAKIKSKTISVVIDVVSSASALEVKVTNSNL